MARRLERQPVQAQDTEELVREVAAVASGNFLVAQLTADGIAYSGRAARPFPTDVAEAFRRRLDDLQDESVRELLLPLAYAVGEGLPEDLWLSGVAALSRPYERGDLRRLLRGPAGSFVLTTRDRAGQSGYRLFHQALAETLAAESTPGATSDCCGRHGRERSRPPRLALRVGRMPPATCSGTPLSMPLPPAP